MSQPTTQADELHIVRQSLIASDLSQPDIMPILKVRTGYDHATIRKQLRALRDDNEITLNQSRFGITVTINQQSTKPR